MMVNYAPWCHLSVTCVSDSKLLVSAKGLQYGTGNNVPMLSFCKTGGNETMNLESEGLG